MNDYYKKKAINKMCFTAIIILVYIMGTNLTLPGIDGYQLLDSYIHTPGTTIALEMTGLQLDKISFFSLGLGPWMSALIIWRVLFLTKVFHIQNMTIKNSYTLKFLLSLFMGGVQSLSVLAQIETIKNIYYVPDWMTVTFLVTGLAVLIWLGNMNTQYGIGGSTIIIIISMMRHWPQRILNELTSKASTLEEISSWFIPVMILFCATYLIFRFYQGERRIPLVRIMMDENYISDTYLPIPTNPSGGMPFMFAFSTMLLPQYFVVALQLWQPHNQVIDWFHDNMQLDKIFGVSVFITVLIALTYGFSYVNVDYKEISDSMKKSGDYFYDVYPGKNTENFIFDKVTIMATIASLFNFLIVGIPMYISIIFPEISRWVYFIPTSLIMMILMKEIVLQFDSLYHRNDYQPFMKGLL